MSNLALAQSFPVAAVGLCPAAVFLFCYTYYMTTPKKIIFATIGIIVLAVVWWLASPLFITKKINEALPAGRPNPDPTIGPPQSLPSAELAVLSEGIFTGFDKLHQASGTARIIESGGKKYVRFEEDFTVTNGPDLFVHLGSNGAYDAEANLGRLKGNEGSQNYEIPDHIDVSQYSEVWIWCRAFSVPFGKAVLDFRSI